MWALDRARPDSLQDQIHWLAGRLTFEFTRCGSGSPLQQVGCNEGLGGTACMRNRLRRYSSRNCHVSAPSKRRTRTEAMSSGSKLPRFTPCLAPG